MKQTIKNNKQQQGFTLIEVLVVVVIMAILAMIVLPRIMSRPEQARRTKARTDIMAIQSAMDMYKLDNGFYPSAEQGIAALVHRPSGEPQPQDWQVGGYLKETPVDPWGRSYHYANPGQHGEIDIWTNGPTNQVSGVATIGNWTVKKST